MEARQAFTVVGARYMVTGHVALGSSFYVERVEGNIYSSDSWRRLRR